MKMLRTASQLIAVAALCATPPVAWGAPFFEGFEGYAAGSGLHGQGGWAGWDNTASAGAPVSTAFAFAGTQSAQIIGTSDLTHVFSDFTSGMVEFSARQYVPSSSTGASFLILLNTYNAGGPYAWSSQIQADMAQNKIISDNGGGASLPLIKDQWVEYRLLIDLTANSVSEFYNGSLLSTHAWYDNTDPNAAARLQGIDLYGNGAGPVYYDNISITAVPEPGSLTLLAMGSAAWLLRRRIAR